MNKSSNLFLGGIFVAGMATTYLLRQMKVMGAETRIFNACSYHQPQSLTSDGYETNSPNPSNQAASAWSFIKSNTSALHPFRLECGASGWNFASLSQAKSGAQSMCSNPWKDMTKAVQTSCPHCCTSGSSTSSSPPAGSISGNGSSGGGSSTSSSTTSCPACDSCCPTPPPCVCDSCCGQCPECMDCPPAVKCDSCCGNQGEQSTFLGRLFGR